jgi:hypothetical protein
MPWVRGQKDSLHAMSRFRFPWLHAGMRGNFFIALKFFGFLAGPSKGGHVASTVTYAGMSTGSFSGRQRQTQPSCEGILGKPFPFDSIVFGGAQKQRPKVIRRP